MLLTSASMPPAASREGSDGTTASAEVPDEALVASFLAGDRNAYRAIVLRYARLLIAYATRLTGDAGTAEDVAQEAFLRLYTKAQELRADRLRPWLYTVARNACLDALRRRRRDPHSLPDAAPSLPGDEPEPSDDLERRELRERVDSALAQLNDDQRNAFILCVLQNLSYEDAARVLGCSVKTLSSRLVRARERFRELLKEARS